MLWWNSLVSWNRSRSVPRRRMRKTTGLSGWNLQSLSTPEVLELRQLLTNYDIGPGFAYTALGDFPWETLQPGDEVAIHGRAEPYREHVFISASGTPEAPITITGVLGPQGEVPIIDGANAVQSASLDYAYPAQARRGLVTVSLGEDDLWGYKPHDLIFSNLTIRNAEPNQTFTTPTGPQTFLDNAAAIYIERGERIQILNCDISLSANGIFVASNDSEATQSREILISGNYVHDNGNVGSDRHHNAYTEAIGIIYEGNHFGPLRPGSGGNNIKDRSAGLIIRNNWIENGAHLLDLVDAEGSSAQASIDPSYQQTLVYGNVLIDGSGPGTASSIVHYGGDSYVFDGYRKGTLYFYSNTVIIQADRTGEDGRWQTNLLRLDTNDQIADVRNNIIYRSRAVGSDPSTEPTGLTLLKNDGGTVHFDTNWISPGWITWYNEDAPTGGSVTGLDALFSPANNDPGFVDLATYQLDLLATSSAIDLAEDLPPAIAGLFETVQQYSVHQSTLPRQVNGMAGDLGAFELPSAVAPGGIQFATTQRTIAETASEIRLLVVRQSGTAGAVSIQYATQDGTAVAGVDYVTTTGELHFAAGQTSAEIVIPLVANSPTDGSRTYSITLSNPQGGATLLAKDTQTVTITDPQPTNPTGSVSVTWENESESVVTGATQVTLTIVREGNLAGTTTVAIRTKNGKAKAGKEYDKLATEIVFAAGESTKTITVTLLNTRLLTKPRHFKVLLQAFDHGQKLGRKQLLKVNILPS